MPCALSAFDLQASFLASRVCGEDRQDERRAIENATRQRPFEVALLQHAERCVDTDDFDGKVFDACAQGFDLPLAEQGGGGGAMDDERLARDDVKRQACRTSESRHLFETVLRVLLRLGRLALLSACSRQRDLHDATEATGERVCTLSPVVCCLASVHDAATGTLYKETASSGRIVEMACL